MMTDDNDLKAGLIGMEARAHVDGGNLCTCARAVKRVTCSSCGGFRVVDQFSEPFDPEDMREAFEKGRAEHMSSLARDESFDDSFNAGLTAAIEVLEMAKKR